MASISAHMQHETLHETLNTLYDNGRVTDVTHTVRVSLLILLYNTHCAAHTNHLALCNHSHYMHQPQRTVHPPALYAPTTSTAQPPARLNHQHGSTTSTVQPPAQFSHQRYMHLLACRGAVMKTHSEILGPEMCSQLALHFDHT